MSAVIHDIYNENDAYVKVDNNEDVYSFNYWNDLDSPVDLYIIADWLLDNEEKIKELDIIDNDNGEKQ